MVIVNCATCWLCAGGLQACLNRVAGLVSK